MAALRKSKSKCEVFVIIGHRIEDVSTNRWSVTYERRKWVFDYVNNNNIKYYTLSELINSKR